MMLVRRGYGRSQGPDSEFLDSAEASGLAGAQDVRSAVEYMRRRTIVMRNRIVLIGQSQGGWIALAASTLPIDGVLGVVNISGAINFRNARGHSIRSEFVEAQLNDAAATYGGGARVPTLWIYAENDNHSAETVRRWFDSFQKNGGKGRLIIEPPYRDHGHAIVDEPALYIDDLARFFQGIGFTAHPPASGTAPPGEPPEAPQGSVGPSTTSR